MSGNVSSGYGAGCEADECRTHSEITDFERGEVVCGGCGLILMQNIPDASYQDGGRGRDDFMRTARTGPATSLMMHDKGLSTMIGSNKDSAGNVLQGRARHDFNRLRVWDKRSRSRRTAALSKALTQLNGMKAKLGIPENVAESAAYIYRKAAASGLTRGRTMASLVSASLYAACRAGGIPRTLDDVADAGNVEKRMLSRDLRTVVRKLGLSLDQYDTASFVSKIANNMGLREKVKRDAFGILRRCEDLELTAGKHPVAQAAASLYLSAILNGEGPSQKRFAAESGISDVTIRNRVAVIRKALKLAG